VSGQVEGAAVDLAAVVGRPGSDTGVAHGGELLAFTEAVMGDDEAERGRTRERLRAVLSPEAFVDVAATIGAFNVVDRIADATGIPLDDAMRAASAEVRRALDLGRFASAANTPDAG
jgi:hypothetical protein